LRKQPGVLERGNIFGEKNPRSRRRRHAHSGPENSKTGASDRIRTDDIQIHNLFWTLLFSFHNIA